jgi:aspartate/methionine/tyrosine aminotransferase
MNLQAHAVDQWLQQHSAPPVEFDLGSSTGPHWTLRELLALGDKHALDGLLDIQLLYSRTAGGTALRDAIAAMQRVDPEHVVVTIGAAEALWHLFLTVAEPTANVVVPFPCFPPHRTMPAGLGLEVRLYHLRRENNYQIDLDEVRALIDAKTKIVLVNLPNNPTGATLSDAEMAQLHDFAAERGVQFVVDEVHHPIYFDEPTASAAHLPRATSVGDFSKAFSLPGLRLGWVIEPDPRRRERYLNAREYITISNSPIVEFAAQIAVAHCETLWGRTQQVAGANLKCLDRLMASYPDVLTWIRPRGGMTGFPWLTSGEHTRGFCEAAAREGLLVVPGDCFGVPEHFRVGFGISTEWFPKAMDRFAQFLDGRRLHRDERPQVWGGAAVRS